MLKLLQKLLIILLLVVGSLYLLYQGFLYYRSLDKMPTDMTVAGLDVAGLTVDQVAELLITRYMAPVTIQHREESVEMNPVDVGFILDLETMLREAETQSTPEDKWLGYCRVFTGPVV